MPSSVSLLPLGGASLVWASFSHARTRFVVGSMHLSISRPILLRCTHPFRGGKHASQHFQTHQN